MVEAAFGVILAEVAEEEEASDASAPAGSGMGFVNVSLEAAIVKTKPTNWLEVTISEGVGPVIRGGVKPRPSGRGYKPPVANQVGTFCCSM